jgi:primosomal protein N' (replication factor Y)
MFFIALAAAPTFPGVPGRQRTTVNRDRMSGSDTAESYQTLYVSVALPVPVRRLFTYAVPAGLAGGAEPGCRARVPLGRRALTGVIVSSSATTDMDPGKIRPVAALPDRAPIIGEGLLETLTWASRYYVAAPGAVMSMALPPGGGAAARTTAWYSATGSPELDPPLRRAPRQRDLLAMIRAEPGPVSGESIRAQLGESAAALSALVRKGLLTVERRAVPSPPEILAPPSAVVCHVLTAEQASAVGSVAAAIEMGGYAARLLLGPTGSGKTEVYLAAIESALALGKSSIYLVPEISLTPLLAGRCRDRFGSRFALLHSSLTTSQRREEWERIRGGEARMILGARSALMAPVDALGLVVVDEEQDSSFKQESEPRYNARDLAMVRARKEGAVVLLGSATPSLETYRLTEEKRITLLPLTRRIGARPMAAVEVIDMRREEEETGGTDPISRRLLSGIRDALGRGEQAILFLNRRGWAPSLICRKCGEGVQCRRCSISLTWHRRDEVLLCHYCGYRLGMPERCPECHGEKLLLTGTGTEKLEEEISAIFPEARVARLDRDVARGRLAPGRILAGFERGDHDILVGTQLVAKGHDFPNVTMVGVVGADFTLGFPDFRAAERTFQILTQVAGRAGRGERRGEVIVQAWRPDHYAIRAAADQDYRAFYARESRYRRLMGYPPFTALACLTASGSTEEGARRLAAKAADAVRRCGRGDVRLTGPAPAPLLRLKGKYRFQIVARAGRRRRLSDILNEALDALECSRGGARGLVVDIDPASLL